MLKQPDQLGRVAGGDVLRAHVHRGHRGLVADRRVADMPFDGGGDRRQQRNLVANYVHFAAAAVKL